MAGHLLLVIFMCSFPLLKAQAIVPPTLTVDPAVITETDSVTMNCQPPSSVSVLDCYFNIMKKRPSKRFPCQHTLTGSELLTMSQQSSPAAVKVTCLYLNTTQSPESATSSIIIRSSIPPKLTVNPPVVNETDLVTVNCQVPPSFSMSKCFFYTSSGDVALSCQQTLTGTELLKMAHQGSPAEVKLTCFYVSKLGDDDSPSPHSATSSIIILNIPKIESSKSPTMNAFTLTTGQNMDRPASTTITTMKQTSGLTLSTKSNIGSFVSTFPTSVKPSSGLTVSTKSNIGSFVSTFSTSVKPPSGSSVSNPDTEENIYPEIPLKTASGMWIWKFVAIAAGCGVTVSVMFLVSAALCNRRRAGSEEQKRRESECHYYSVICDEAAVTAQKDMLYSTVQSH